MIDTADLLKLPYPAKSHARRVAKRLLERTGAEGGLIYLEAQKTVMLEDNDSAGTSPLLHPYT